MPILGVAVLISLDKATVTCSDLLCTSSPISAVLHRLEEDELLCKEIRIALGVAAPTPMRARKAENLLRGKKISDELIGRSVRCGRERGPTQRFDQGRIMVSEGYDPGPGKTNDDEID